MIDYIDSKEYEKAVKLRFQELRRKGWLKINKNSTIFHVPNVDKCLYPDIKNTLIKQKDKGGFFVGCSPYTLLVRIDSFALLMQLIGLAEEIQHLRWCWCDYLSIKELFCMIVKKVINLWKKE